MPRPRKPTKILEAKGAFRKDPQRKRTDPVVSGVIGEPPDYLNDAEMAAWSEIAENAPVNVLSSADRMVVEVAARGMAKFRALSPEDITGSLMQQIISALGRLGMTPADRSKVSAPEQKPENPFAKFATSK